MERNPDFHRKHTIRKEHLALRDSMTLQETEEKSAGIAVKLLSADWFKDCQVLYGYYPLGNEVDCRAVLCAALLAGKKVALPRTGTNSQMEFYRIDKLSQVAEGNFHVMEPRMECPLVQEENGIVLVPGVVFDKQGNRYGYGKGYYDRYLKRYPKLRTIAIAYEHQVEDTIAVEDTDIPMEWVYTESNIYGIT